MIAHDGCSHLFFAKGADSECPTAIEKKSFFSLGLPSTSQSRILLDDSNYP